MMAKHSENEIRLRFAVAGVEIEHAIVLLIRPAFEMISKRRMPRANLAAGAEAALADSATP